MTQKIDPGTPFVLRGQGRILVGVYLLAVLLILLQAWLAGENPFATSTYARWDSGHYLGIAEKGYELRMITPEEDPNYVVPALGGNTGWFPGYPVAISALHLVGVPIGVGALLIAWVGLFLCLMMIQRIAAHLYPDQPSWMVLLLAIAFPGVVYYQALFPISMVTFFGLWSLYLLLLGRNWQAGITMALAAYSYTTGFLIIPVAGAWILLRSAEPFRDRARQAFIACGLGSIGFVGVFYHMYLATGRGDAFFVIQGKYGHDGQVPFGALAHAFARVLHGAGDAFAAHLQTLVVCALMVTLIVVGVVRARRQFTDEVMVLAFVALCWLFPLVMGGSISLTRQEALLLPAVLLLHRFSMPQKVALLVVFLLLRVFVTTLFFSGAII